MKLIISASKFAGIKIMFWRANLHPIVGNKIFRVAQVMIIENEFAKISASVINDAIILS